MDLALASLLTLAIDKGFSVLSGTGRPKIILAKVNKSCTHIEEWEIYREFREYYRHKYYAQASLRAIIHHDNNIARPHAAYRLCTLNTSWAEDTSIVYRNAIFQILVAYDYPPHIPIGTDQSAESIMKQSAIANEARSGICISAIDCQQPDKLGSLWICRSFDNTYAV